MRLKTYTAPTTAEAMAIVRRELGDQAIIVSTQKDADGRGARVTAALENAPEPLLDAAEAPAEPVNVTETVR
ncbi:MAG: GTP-binding protein, partial [Elusimicrobia bacterium CG11_big_fil_rev_8_21_14_0_20_64_6]